MRQRADRALSSRDLVTPLELECKPDDLDDALKADDGRATA